MEQNLILANCVAELERMIAIVKSGAKTDDIEFFDDCEESSSAMLITLNDLLKNSTPTDEFKVAFKKVNDFNLWASAQIASCEQMQREKM